jgi:hypothetical protein
VHADDLARLQLYIGWRLALAGRLGDISDGKLHVEVTLDKVDLSVGLERPVS